MLKCNFTSMNVAGFDSSLPGRHVFEPSLLVFPGVGWGGAVDSKACLWRHYLTLGLLLSESLNVIALCVCTHLKLVVKTRGPIFSCFQ